MDTSDNLCDITGCELEQDGGAPIGARIYKGPTPREIYLRVCSHHRALVQLPPLEGEYSIENSVRQ